MRVPRGLPGYVASRSRSNLYARSFASGSLIQFVLFFKQSIVAACAEVTCTFGGTGAFVSRARQHAADFPVSFFADDSLLSLR